MASSRPINSDSRLTAYSAAVSAHNASVRQKANEELSEAFDAWLSSEVGICVGGDLIDKTRHICYNHDSLQITFTNTNLCHPSVLDATVQMAASLGYETALSRDAFGVLIIRAKGAAAVEKCIAPPHQGHPPAANKD